MISNLAFLVRMASASVATLTSCVVLPLLAQGNQKFRSTPVIVGAVILACSGWLYADLKVRIVGIVHAVVMLGIGSYSLAIGLPFLLNPHGMADNAAAGAIALANLVVTAFGALTFACGVAVISQALFSRRDGTGKASASKPETLAPVNPPSSSQGE